MVVKTSADKFHAYWATELPVAQFKVVQQAIAKYLGTDPAVCNPARVMRVPGFLHQKNPEYPQLVTAEVLQGGGDWWTALLDREAAKPVAAKQRGGKMRKTQAQLLDALQRIPNDDYETWMTAGMSLAADGQDVEVFVDWSRGCESFDEAECHRQWNYWCQNLDAKDNPRGIGSVFRLADENQTGQLNNLLEQAETTGNQAAAEALLRDSVELLAKIKHADSVAYERLRDRFAKAAGVSKTAVTKLVLQRGGGDAGPGELNAEQIAFLDRFVYLLDDHLVADEQTGQIIPATGFNLLAQKEADDWGDLSPLVALVRRAGADRPIVKSETYLPGQPRLVTREAVEGYDALFLNVYQAPSLPLAVSDPVAEKLFLDHLDYLVGYCPVMKTYLLNWMAMLIQRPGERVNSAPVLINANKGTGKTFLVDLLTALLGASNVALVTPAELAGDFQDGYAFKQLRVIDEIKVYEHQGSLMESLKPWLTNNRVSVNRKGRTRLAVENVGNWLFISNHEDAIRIDKAERRYAVAISREAPKPDAYYRTLFQTLIPSCGGSLAAVLQVLRSVDLAAFNPKAPAPSSEARDDLIDSLMSAEERALSDLLASPRTGGLGKHELFSVRDVELLLRFATSPVVGASASKPKSNAQISRTAKAVGLENLGRVRVAGGRLNLFAWKNAARWQAASASEIERQLQRQGELTFAALHPLAR